MKKYFTLMVLAIFGGLLMMSCEMNEVVDEIFKIMILVSYDEGCNGNF